MIHYGNLSFIRGLLLTLIPVVILILVSQEQYFPHLFLHHVINEESQPSFIPSGYSEKVQIPRPFEPLRELLESERTNCPHLEAHITSWDSLGLTPTTEGDDVTLPDNTTVVLSNSIATRLGFITVPDTSSLILGENSNGIYVDFSGMIVRGRLLAGSETCRIETPIVLTLHGSRPSDAVENPPAPHIKGISVEGGEISLHGKRYFRTWTRLSASVNVGENLLILQDTVNWEVGQQIVLVTTAMKDARDWHQNEVLEIKAVSNSNPRDGTGAAIEVTTGARFTHAANEGYQAEVALITRTIRIQGAAADSVPFDDDPSCSNSASSPPSAGGCNNGLTQWMGRFEWIKNSASRLFGFSNYPGMGNNLKWRPEGDGHCAMAPLTGYGAHVIVQAGGLGYVEGVEFLRVGQTNIKGRYPMHFHLLGDGCPSCYVRDSSFHESYYRCISIHGTNTVTITENVAYDVTGYCYYLEDGVEENNRLTFNLVALVHMLGLEPPTSDSQFIDVYTQSNTLTLPADVTASGFYITNVKNVLIGNTASGGWAGFAFPVLRRPVGSFRDVTDYDPSVVTALTIDGNTAHSSSWWWGTSGGFYLGGSLYYDNEVLTYNAGRDLANQRTTCITNQRGCKTHEYAWIRFTNTKVYLTAGIGFLSWNGQVEVVGFESHDAGLSVSALTRAGFWLDSALVVCRTGTAVPMPPGSSLTSMRGSGFEWYDTGQEHIITDSTFRNCGYSGACGSRFTEYDKSPARGCGNDPDTGCWSGSSVFAFLSHSDQFNPELMQATSGISFDNCGRRYNLQASANTISARIQNWLDIDGSASGLDQPTIIGSGVPDGSLWWTVDDRVVDDPQGPLKFIPINDGPERGLAHVRMEWDDELHASVGDTMCDNGGGAPCPTVGYIRHLGPRFSGREGNQLEVKPNAEFVGPAGGFGWLLQLDAGAPKTLNITQVEIDPSTPLTISIPYPPGTTFEVSANIRGCTQTEQFTCREVFAAVSSVQDVRASDGNTYHVSNDGVLTFRVIQSAGSFVGNPSFVLPSWDDLDSSGEGYALNRFERKGVRLPIQSRKPFLMVVANCDANGAYCTGTPGSIDDADAVCPSGYSQESYDKCCECGSCVYANGQAESA